MKFIYFMQPGWRDSATVSLQNTLRIITMAVTMDDIWNKAGPVRKPTVHKIALLGLFTLSLLTAYLIVVFKSGISYSDPIGLSQTGLSVSIPAGKAWQSDRQWQFRDNMFSLISLFPTGSERPTAWTNCSYLLSAEKNTPQMRFEQRASEINAEIEEINRTKAVSKGGSQNSPTIHWARIEKKEWNFTLFLATAELPDNRQIDIEAAQISGDGEIAKTVFEHIIENLIFDDNKLLNTGAEVVEEIKSRGLAGFLNNQNRQAFFLIKDASKSTVGFTMDVIVETGTEAQPNIQAAGLYYIRTERSREQGTSFQCSNDLNEFVYKSEISHRMGRSGTETVLDGNGVITVRKFQDRPAENTYHLGPAAIPDVFLDQILMQMLENGISRIIVDIIDAGGNIIPTHIAAIEVTKDLTAGEDAAYAFMLELMDGRGFSEKIYLNNQKQIYLRLARQDNIYILERAEVESIVDKFPEHAELILRKKQMLR